MLRNLTRSVLRTVRHQAPVRSLTRTPIAETFAMPASSVRRSARNVASTASAAQKDVKAETKAPEAKGKKATTAKTTKKAVAAEDTVAADTVADAAPGSSPKGGRKRKAPADAMEEPAAEDGSEDASVAKGKKTKATASGKAASARKPTAGGHPESPSAPSSSKVDILAPSDFPKNVDIPKELSHISNEARAASTFRLASWNIVSLKSSEAKGLTRYLEAENADVVFLSETKVNEIPSFFLKEKYPHQTWAIGETKSYAGVAILSKVKPLSVIKGLPTLQGYDSKGRCLTAEFRGCYIVGTYCVNAGEGLKTIDEKQRWQEALSRHIHSLDAKKPVIWTGDLNVVLDERDLSKAGTKWNKSAGYTQIECDHHRAFLEGRLDSEGKPPIIAEDQGASRTSPAYSDVWRQLHPDAQGHFSYYGWRGQCRIKGSGWRLDTFITSQRITEQCKGCEIRQDIYGASDHLPVYADFDKSLFV